MTVCMGGDDENGPKRLKTRRLGHRYVFFLKFIVFFLLIIIFRFCKLLFTARYDNNNDQRRNPT